MFIEKWRNLIIPNWFKNLFYVAFFVFTNIYYFFGLFNFYKLSLMSRISLRCEVFQLFSNPFSGHVCSLSAFVCICKLFLNILVFNV